MTKKWIAREDCEIVRPSSGSKAKITGHAVLLANADTTRYFLVPEFWSDAQIWECLDIANIAFTDGHSQGKEEKAREIRLALGLQEDKP